MYSINFFYPSSSLGKFRKGRGISSNLTCITSRTLKKRCILDRFFFSSRYPVILSLENHCSVSQQKVMARLLRDIFKDILYQFFTVICEELSYCSRFYFSSAQAQGLTTNDKNSTLLRVWRRTLRKILRSQIANYGIFCIS